MYDEKLHQKVPEFKPYRLVYDDDEVEWVAVSDPDVQVRWLGGDVCRSCGCLDQFGPGAVCAGVDLGVGGGYSRRCYQLRTRRRESRRRSARDKPAELQSLHDNCNPPQVTKRTALHAFSAGVGAVGKQS